MGKLTATQLFGDIIGTQPSRAGVTWPSTLPASSAETVTLRGAVQAGDVARTLGAAKCDLVKHPVRIEATNPAPQDQRYWYPALKLFTELAHLRDRPVEFRSGKGLAATYHPESLGVEVMLSDHCPFSVFAFNWGVFCGMRELPVTIRIDEAAGRQGTRLVDAALWSLNVTNNFALSLQELAVQSNPARTENVKRWMNQRDFLIQNEAAFIEALRGSAKRFKKAFNISCRHVLGTAFTSLNISASILSNFGPEDFDIPNGISLIHLFEMGSEGMFHPSADALKVKMFAYAHRSKGHDISLPTARNIAYGPRFAVEAIDIVKITRALTDYALHIRDFSALAARDRKLHIEAFLEVDFTRVEFRSNAPLRATEHKLSQPPELAKHGFPAVEKDEHGTLHLRIPHSFLAVAS